jgi:hypothetical protein
MPGKVEEALLGGLRPAADSIPAVSARPRPRHNHKKGNGECLLQNA